MSRLEKIPLFYHPTNVILIDDEKRFLHELNQHIDDIYSVVMESDSKKAYRYLSSHVYDPRTLSKELIQPSYESIGKDPFTETYDISFVKLHEGLDQPDRFKKIVSVVIDRYMPKFDGFAFCEKAKEDKLAARFIMLTGMTELGSTIDAFNRKIIDAYVDKMDDHVIEKINQFISESTWQQFLDISKELVGSISHILKPLEDERFNIIFQNILKKYQICEFYIVDSSCSFFLFDAEGNAKVLFVRQADDFDSVYDIAKESKVPYDILQVIRSRQQFPYTRSSIGHLTAKGDAWEEIMTPMEKIPGREIYYSLVDEKLDIFPFSKYQGEVWPEP